MTAPAYKQIPVDDLIPYARNSRTHSDDQILKVASSIKEFGFLSPVIVDGQNGIIAGHCRVMAAKKLGIKKVPCIEASHLSETQKRAYVIADNRLALDSAWDMDLLEIEIDALKEQNFDIDLTGFDVSELNFTTANYDALEDEDLEDELSEMAQGVKKAIMIEFEIDDYQEAQEVIKFWRQEGAYVGRMIMDYLIKEKSKL